MSISLEKSYIIVRLLLLLLIFNSINSVKMKFYVGDKNTMGYIICV